jgi:hypothetical protein
LAKEYYNENYLGKDDAEYSLVHNTCQHGSDSSTDKSDQKTEEAEEEDDDVNPNPQDVEVGNIVLPLEIEDGTDCDSSDSSSGKDMKEQVEDGSPRSNKELCSLAVIAFLGAVDDLALLVSMLVGKTFGIVELVIGTMISTLANVLICISLTKCKLVAGILEKIPLVQIVMGFCVVLLAKGIFFMD